VFLREGWSHISFYANIMALFVSVGLSLLCVDSEPYYGCGYEVGLFVRFGYESRFFFCAA